jgi:hypothetical protein
MEIPRTKLSISWWKAYREESTFICWVLQNPSFILNSLIPYEKKGVRVKVIEVADVEGVIQRREIESLEIQQITSNCYYHLEISFIDTNVTFDEFDKLSITWGLGLNVG